MKLHEKGKVGGLGKQENNEFNELKEKIMEFKDKISVGLSERYASGKLSLAGFLKRYYLAIFGLLLLGYIYYSYLPEQISI